MDGGNQGCASASFFGGSRFKGAATERLDRVVQRIDREIFRFYGYCHGNGLFRDIGKHVGLMSELSVSVSKDLEMYPKIKRSIKVLEF